MEPPSDERLDRAVTSPIGISLILVLTLTAAVGIVVFGAAAFEDTQRETRISGAEQALTQFDSRTSQVALGVSDSKRVELGRGNYRVDESAGSVNITHVDWDNDGSNKTILETTDLGAVTYEADGTTIAYQGGGVWRKDADGDALMVSPPEFHYRDRTLTYPIVTVAGGSARSGEARARVSNGSTTPVYPSDQTYDGTTPFENPTASGSILVEIESTYCEGWESFFESRSEGVVHQPCDEGDDRTVIIDLSVPFEETFASPLSYSEDFQCDGGNKNYECPEAEESSRPSVSDHIDSEISNCETGGCEDLSQNPGEIEEGTYFANETVTFDDDTEFNTTDGNITLVIDAMLEYNGEASVVGDGEVQILLREGYDMSGGDGMNEGGEARQVQKYVHSDVDEIRHSGTNHLTGVVYAPGSKFVQGGTGTIKGAVIAETIVEEGNPASDWVWDPSLDDFKTDLIANQSPITYLHVTKNEVEVEFE